MTHVKRLLHVQSHLHPSQGPALSSKCLGSDFPPTMFSSRDPDSHQLCQACRWPPLGLLPDFCLLSSPRCFCGPSLGSAPHPSSGAPPTWCRNTCCCFCCIAASPRAVREESMKANGPTPPARGPRRSLGSPSTLVEDSMSLSSSFRDVMTGTLHTGW